MTKVLEYKTVVRTNSTELDAAVNIALRHGFLLYGSPYSARSDWCQALIKPDPSEAPMPSSSPIQGF